jgi:hypothetical protein
VAFATHPPVLYREHFLEWSANKLGKTLDPDAVWPWREAFNVLFAAYSERYPPLD